MLTTQLGYGGSERSFLSLAKQLSRACDITVALFTRGYGGSCYAPIPVDVPFPLVVLDEPAPSGQGMGALGRWSNRIRRLRELKSRNDVTISFLSGPNLLNALVSPGNSIVSERGSKLHHMGMRPASKLLWTRIIDPIVYRRASFVVPASRDYAEEVRRIAGPRAASKVTPIEGGINAAQLVAAGNAGTEGAISRLAAYPTIVSCGRLDRGKGLDFLLHVFSGVKRRVPQARLLVIGDGPLLPELIATAERLRLTVTQSDDLCCDADVFLAGYRADPVRYFGLGTVFAFTSEHEGLPNVLIEAVASGVQVLAADCPYGPRSVLSSGRPDARPIVPGKLPLRLDHGVLMPRVSADGSGAVWVDQLVSCLLARKALRSVEDRKLAIQRFDSSVTGRQWLELVSQLTLVRRGGI